MNQINLVFKIAAAVIASLGGGAAIVFSLSSYLGRFWADRALEKLRQEHASELEKLRQEHATLNLQFTHDLTLATERVKTDLQMTAIEHQVRFSALHEKRARIIASLDKRLYELDVHGQHYVEGYQGYGETADEAFSEWLKEFQECRAFIEYRRIYLPERIYTMVHDFLRTAGEPVIHTRVVFRSPQPEQHQQLILQAVNVINTRVPQMRSALTREFRAMLDGLPAE